MIKLKSEKGKCHLQMEGSALDFAGDVVTALNAIMHALNKEQLMFEASAMKDVIKAWAEGDFDD